jgi:hypothetical protein
LGTHPIQDHPQSGGLGSHHPIVRGRGHRSEKKN